MSNTWRIKFAFGCVLVLYATTQGNFSALLRVGTPEAIGEMIGNGAIFGAGVWLMVTGYRGKRRQLRMESRYCRFCSASHLAEARYCIACGKGTH